MSLLGRDDLRERIVVMFPFLKKIREARRPRCAALVAAAGSSSRMGGVNKLLEPLDGIPVLARTLTAL